MGSPYDFKIDTLEFRCAIKDDTPYARQTAPFRKDQFDTSGQAGDQSLTGWWTRGQFSFHHGSGIKYYELAGDASGVLDRFESSNMVDVFTPGKVTLAPAVTQFATPLAGATRTLMASGPEIANDGTTRAAWIEDAAGTYKLRVMSEGTISTITTGSGGSFLGYLADDSDSYYYVTSIPTGIERVAKNATAGTQIYTHTQGIEGLWMAKERLWVLDTTGTVYALPPRPSSSTAISSTDKVFSVPDGASSFDRWCFAAGPGPVYLGFKNRVYMVQPDATGAVPTLTAGIVVAQLPQGESIISMRYALGNLMLCTSAGIRAAYVASDGSLIYGPLILKGKGVSKEMGSLDSSVYALVNDVGGEDPGTRLVRVDLEFQVTDLVFAYSTSADTLTFDILNDSKTPAVTAGSGGVLVCGTNNDVPVLHLYQSTEPAAAKAATGTLTTGFHRFATLDPKIFKYLLVKTSGSAGTVDVTALLPGGTSVSIGSVNAGDSAEFDLGPKVPGALEYIGLQFTLNGAGADGPTLLGYQLKALPVPKRQRLLKWPLQLTDTFRDKYRVGHGKKGRAWSDLRALEALESSQAIVPFEDYRTGETGSAYIDSVQFQSDTPSTPTSNGFGGIAYVQLRVIS